MPNESIAGLRVYIGILAGVWPCGVVAFLSELFISESKSQVYGALHSFYQLVPTTASSIGEYIFVHVVVMLL